MVSWICSVLLCGLVWVGVLVISIVLIRNV